ncbi:BnaA03g53900D [Brassica napus]|uniref:BnaA03g53900D protein n=1 Tax=Brassica napus TaxID=3708 RepID=A0A078GSX0_BRANA|nr:BnaA03g53900D [Brassica napus]
MSTMKPSRSDEDLSLLPTKPQTTQRLTSSKISSHKLMFAAVQEEFLETGDYTNLPAIDKQHHTTGSGFIKVVKEDGGEDTFTAAAALDDGGEKAVCRSNPAMNDWIVGFLLDGGNPNGFGW